MYYAPIAPIMEILCLCVVLHEARLFLFICVGKNLGKLHRTSCLYYATKNGVYCITVSGTSDKGPSEKGTTSLQRTLLQVPSP